MQVIHQEPSLRQSSQGYQPFDTSSSQKMTKQMGNLQNEDFSSTSSSSKNQSIHPNSQFWPGRAAYLS